MPERLQEIKNYWDARSQGFSEASQEELENNSAQKWKSLFSEYIRPGCKVLDDGAGAGFFTVLLAESGYEVDAIDYSEEMLSQVRMNLSKRNLTACLSRMDAQNLAFEDQTFDAVVSRDVFWCLEHPETAYKEAARVLKPGGTLILKDGNYYLHLYNKKYEQARKEKLAKNPVPEDTHGHLRHNVGNVDFSIIEKIAEELPLSKCERPQFDLSILMECGFRDIRIQIEGEPLPMGFLIIATKKGIEPC